MKTKYQVVKETKGNMVSYIVEQVPVVPGGFFCVARDEVDAIRICKDLENPPKIIRTVIYP